ncbi:NUDIX hydrolase domain-like protein [Cladorrhinum samala]|uniref:NUDIX hydrolase domain-like protein n=1 Tax=Cladorrhinum samala TaxID=585594 RepID=A0AAV9H8N6_9PEZI|nr:NUDIX hydrolase domain-like protein [Cladorrhinum samala]
MWGRRVGVVCRLTPSFFPSSFLNVGKHKPLPSLPNSLPHPVFPRKIHSTGIPQAKSIRPLKMSSAKSQEPVINSVTELPTDKARWVTLQQINYTDQTGKARTWEVAARKTRSAKSGVDAVAIGNILLPANGGPPSTIVVIQYRPPLDAYTVEWPAGLIDQGETAEQAAVREFREETGYEVTRVVDVSPVQSADPGMSSANMQMVMVEVDLPEGQEELPQQRLEDGEHIERVVVRLDQFYDTLVEYSKRERFMVAAKLFHFAAGMQFVRTRGKELKLI